MSAKAEAFGISFDSAIKRSEKKIAGPTVSLMRDILVNACMDEGEWFLRNSKRIKKKGREKFRATRIEDRGGTRGIRVWCKPRGNDTCFEYTLVPPKDIDIQTLFGLLKRVNPVSLNIPESISLPKAFVDHIVDARPNIRQSEPVFAVETVPKDEFTPEAEAEIKEAMIDLDNLDHGVSKAQVADVVAPPKAKVSLLLDEPALLSEQEVMDKALIAISLVAERGYAKKNVASASIIENLGIKNFIENVSGGTYTSVEGAMRSLTMAMRGRGYLDRVHYTAEDGSVSKGVRGYKLTPKAEKRIVALEALYGDSVAYRAVLGRVRTNGATMEAAGPMLPGDPGSDALLRPHGYDEIDATEPVGEGLNSEDLPRLKSLISQHEEADLQLKEIDGILANLDSEIADIQIDMTGLELAERDKAIQIESLQGDLDRIRAKKAAASSGLEKKRRERREWDSMKLPHVSEKSKVEAEICMITGRNKQ
jgi:hypothetical protein